MATVLELQSVVAGYGAGDILRGVDLDISAGTITCLIGPNGAGKSTVLKTISGLLRPRLGKVTYRGEDLHHLSPRARLLRGIVHVPQERSLFPAMTVSDNLLMGGYAIKNPKVVRARIELAIEAFPICARRAKDHAGALSGGEQKQIELARTLILDPQLILLDEPSIGLDPKSRASVFASIRSLVADRTRSVLLVEQNARSGLAAADVGAVLVRGRVRLVASGASLLDNPEVAELYLGTASVPLAQAHPASSSVSPQGEA